MLLNVLSRDLMACNEVLWRFANGLANLSREPLVPCQMMEIYRYCL